MLQTEINVKCRGQKMLHCLTLHCCFMKYREFSTQYMLGYNTETIQILEASVGSYDSDFHRLIRHCENVCFLPTISVPLFISLLFFTFSWWRDGKLEVSNVQIAFIILKTICSNYPPEFFCLLVCKGKPKQRSWIAVRCWVLFYSWNVVCLGSKLCVCCLDRGWGKGT